MAETVAPHKSSVEICEAISRERTTVGQHASNDRFCIPARTLRASVLKGTSPEHCRSEHKCLVLEFGFGSIVQLGALAPFKARRHDNYQHFFINSVPGNDGSARQLISTGMPGHALRYGVPCSPEAQQTVLPARVFFIDSSLDVNPRCMTFINTVFLP